MTDTPLSPPTHFTVDPSLQFTVNEATVNPCFSTLSEQKTEIKSSILA
jgi:hypothetical protein